MKLILDTDWFDCLVEARADVLGEVMAGVLWNRPVESESGRVAIRIIDGFMDHSVKLKSRSGKRAANAVNREKNARASELYSADIEYLYGLYPSKCPTSGRSLGKCSKDRGRIKNLMARLPIDKIASAINDYVTECTDGGRYMKNFATFLNNFPDDGIATSAVLMQEDNRQWQ